MSQAQGNTSKGNGASKRMSNPRRKARMAECFARSLKNAAARNAKQVAAHAYNVAHSDTLGPDFQPTPWQKAKAARRARRAKVNLINEQWLAYELDEAAVAKPMTVEDVLADAGLNADDDINLLFG